MELEEISREICSESDDGRNNSQEPLNIAPEGLLVETVPRGAKYKNCLKWFGCYLLSKLLEFTGFKLTFVQEVYWNAVQRRMVMGQLEYLVEKKEIKDRIPRELAVALMSGDEAIKTCLTNLCRKKHIMILRQKSRDSPSETDEATTSQRHVFGEEEPDTGPLEDENCLTIKELSSSMPDAEDVQELLKDKGGFLDQAWLALKYLYNKKKGVVAAAESKLYDESSDDDESIDADISDTGSEDMFFGKELYSSPHEETNDEEAEEAADFGFSAVKSNPVSLYKLHKWNNLRKSRWNQFNEYIPLRVSNFQYRGVNKVRKAKLNEMWKKAARWPLFTYWVSVVQIIIVLLTLSVHGFAPLRYVPYKERALIQLSDLSVHVVEKNITPNIWAGPDRASLVLLGANYGPCMRRYDPIQNVIDSINQRESVSGCCVRRDSSCCVQTLSNADCPSEIGLADFVTFDNSTELDTSRYSNRAVCGTSPRTCTSPNPRVDPRWMSPNVTGWPICTDSVASNSEHLSCQITGRPCCVGIQAQCIITSQEHCDFLEGKFHKDAFLCSQVNCLKGICGLTPFGKTPDQIQRLGLAVFLHAGIFHVLLTIIFNFYILRDLEKYLGWLATATLYIGSGIGGNIISALFVPYSAEVGPAASMFGVIAFFLIFIVYHWSFFDRAWFEMLKYSIIVVLLFLLGFLPYIDNYARIGGFLFGMMFSFIQIHYIPQHACMTEFNSFRFPNQNAKSSSLLGKIALLITGLVLLLTLYIFSFLWFYLEGGVWNGFSYLNCIIPTSLSDLCQDYRQDISA